LVRAIVKGLVLISAWTVGAALLIVVAAKHGGLSPRGELAVLASYLFGICAITFLLARQFAISARTGAGFANRPNMIDAPSRKWHLLMIRVGKIAVVILAVQVLNMLRLMKEGPLLPLAVGVFVGLLVITAIIIVIRRQQRARNGSPK